MIGRNPSLSVIVPVGRRHAPAESLYAEYMKGLEATGCTYELIFVLDGERRGFRDGLARLHAAGEPLTVVALTRAFGEATAVMAGFARARGRTIVTLPAYHQIAPAGIAELVKAAARTDVAIARRWPRAGGAIERGRRHAYHALLGRVTRLRLNDVACVARAFRREVLEEIQLYGDQYRFLPYLADRHGFRVVEVDVPQSPADRFDGRYSPREYVRSVLDIFSVFFLVRFTKRPLRFFGMVGLTTFGTGAAWLLLLIAQRQLLDVGLADRPALLVAALLMVLGVQVFALGLLGELVIFTHARQLKDYHIAEVIHYSRPTAVPTELGREGTTTR
ncbi:MAG: glycosyltransferase [Pseudomonadota bacterium]